MSDDVVTKQLYSWLDEAVSLRFGEDTNGEKLRVPAWEEGPQAFVSQLIAARQRADRVEELLSKAKRVQSRLSAAQKEAAYEAQVKRDTALAEGARNRAEFSIGDERRAEANLLSFEEKRKERKAQAMVDVADAVTDGIKDAHWGLSGWRNDMRDIVRSFQLESNLER